MNDMIINLSFCVCDFVQSKNYRNLPDRLDDHVNFPQAPHGPGHKVDVVHRLGVEVGESMFQFCLVYLMVNPAQFATDSITQTPFKRMLLWKRASAFLSDCV